MKWQRDPGIVELVEYFNQPDIADDPDSDTGGWSRLITKPNELKAVEEIIRKCRGDFSYFSRNFLWIVDKQRREIPFSLFESQELLLEKILALKKLNKAQKLLILKARQLGCSTLIEGLITWRAVLFGGVSALIVSNTPSHASYLFGILQFAYDRLPWWMKPMTLSRKIEEGLIFDNADHKTRHLRPGLNSKIVVQAANQASGVGQGRTITAAHISELSDWTDEEGRGVIEADLGNALAEGPETFAVIESTARGTGNYFHRLWRKSVELGDLAEWDPVFLPWFFESNRKISIPNPKWQPDLPEQEMRERVEKDWVRCDNQFCLQYRESIQRGVNVVGKRCPVCEIGRLQSYVITNEQLHWMQLKRLNAQKDADSLKALRAEQTSTPEESFQLSGQQVFPQETLDFVNYCLEDPIAKGFFDKSGTFHGMDTKTLRCPSEGCDVDHTYDDMPMLIWKYPEKGVIYVVGVDVAEGLGEDYDYSVAFVNKIGNLRNPDEQVAVFRSNTTDPVAFAYPVNHIGRWYNDAMLAIEINKYDTTFSYVRNQCGYPNLYRWKHVDSTNMLSQKWGWESNMRSKPRLYQNGIHFLKHRMWIVHSKNFYQEATTYQKENADDRGAKAEKGFYDDEVMAGFIALYCAHDSDWDDNMGMIRMKKMTSGDPDTYMWRIVCNKCNEQRGVPSPENAMYCLACGSPYVRAEKNVNPNMVSPNLWEELESGSEDPLRGQAEPEYELM